MITPLLSLVLAATAIAQPGQQYAAGSRVTLPSANLSFVIPKGWFGGLIPGESIFALASHKHAGMVILYADPQGLASLAQEVSQPITLDEGTVLTLNGALQRKAKSLSGRFSLSGNPSVQGLLRGRALGKAALGVLALGPKTESAKHKAWIAAMLRSARAEKSRLGSFAGKQLVYYRTANGMAERRTIRLCRNGRYTESGNNSYLSVGAGSTFSSAGRNQDQGRWQLGGNQLILTDNAGATETFVVRRAEGKLLLNNERWFLRPGDC
jgi:hypothetical protein